MPPKLLGHVVLQLALGQVPEDHLEVMQLRAHVLDPFLLPPGRVIGGIHQVRQPLLFFVVAALDPALRQLLDGLQPVLGVVDVQHAVLDHGYQEELLDDGVHVARGAGVLQPHETVGGALPDRRQVFPFADGLVVL